MSVARSPPRPTGGGRDSRVGSAAPSASSSSSSVVPSNGAGKDDAFRGEIKLAVKVRLGLIELVGWGLVRLVGLSLVRKSIDS